MQRYFIYIAFNGSNYHGWQIQPNAMTVQEAIQIALKTYFQKDFEIVGAGRTDTGVHAREMVAHIDFDVEIDEKEMIYHLNNILPTDISILKVKKVKEDFHARFDATQRTYRYYIQQIKSPFTNQHSLYHNRTLDVEKMQLASKKLLGNHDFSSFSKSKTQTFTNDCEVQFINWEARGNQLVFEIKANRFLRNMVRSIVGTLLEVGEGKRMVDSIPQLMASSDRTKAGPSVPAHGLFLEEIVYPIDGFIEKE